MLTPPKLNEITYNQLLTKSLNRSFTESNGELNDFSRSNPLYVLLSALAWSGSEILYYANKFAERLAYIYLGIISETTSQAGVKAQTKIQVELTEAIPLEIPAGYRVLGTNSSGVRISYFTDEVLRFDGTTTIGEVSATAEDVGTKYNVIPGELNRFSQPLSFVSNITNTTTATGVDILTDEDFISEAIKSIRHRSLVSESDFIYWAQVYMGVGSVASAIGNLSADGSKRELGSVHLFLMDNNLFPASESLIDQVRSSINNNKPPMLGINVYYSPMGVIEVRIELAVSVDSTVTFTGIADSIYRELINYLNPSVHKPGDPFVIRKFESRLWLIPGITDIRAIKLNEDFVDIQTTKNFKLVPQYVSVNIVDPNGIINEILVGSGESVYFPNDD